MTKHQILQNTRRLRAAPSLLKMAKLERSYPLPSFGKEGGSAEPGVFLSHLAVFF